MGKLNAGAAKKRSALSYISNHTTESAHNSILIPLKHMHSSSSFLYFMCSFLPYPKPINTLSLYHRCRGGLEARRLKVGGGRGGGALGQDSSRLGMKEVSAQVYLRLVGWGEGLEKGVLKPEKGGSPRERTPRGGTQGRAPRGRGWWWCGSSGQGAFRLMGVEVGPQGRVPRGQGRGRGGASGREPRGQGGG
uniref:Uncharacterized protein n=1 Tax=Solanum lycopersicum TaxID=4081 RepID=A0A3Q7JBL0_SOLLC